MKSRINHKSLTVADRKRPPDAGLMRGRKQSFLPLQWGPYADRYLVDYITSEGKKEVGSIWGQRDNG